ncbi:hypothetical protein CSW41_08830, partial [Thermus scotoductus]
KSDRTRGGRGRKRLTTRRPMSALLFLGGSVLRDFSLAIFVGIFVGTYSSINGVSDMVG